MAIVEKDGIKFLDGLMSEYVVVESGKIDRYIDYINKNKINSVYLCDLYFFEKDIEFLKECKFIDIINITSSSIESFEGLNHLQCLKNLILQTSKGYIDLSSYTNLTRLSLEVNKNRVGLEKLKNLKQLSLWNYKPKSKNLDEISELKSIRELVITNSTINSLKGCEELLQLERLELRYLGQLCEIDSLEYVKKSMKVLEIESCKHINNYECIACLNNLEKLAINECGDIDTISFVGKLSKLKSFIFMGTNVVDGNLHFCEGLDYVAFVDKKHYSYKNSDFMDRL